MGTETFYVAFVVPLSIVCWLLSHDNFIIFLICDLRRVLTTKTRSSFYVRAYVVGRSPSLS